MSEFNSTRERDHDTFSPEHILALSPRKLVDFVTQLDEQGELEVFLNRASENPALVAQLSYWEKWLTSDHQQLVERVIEKKKVVYPGTKEGLPLDLDRRFTPDELQMIMKQLGAVQLTYGCSKGCPFCGVDAIPGVREHIDYSQLANLFQQYGHTFGKNQPLLYWASEPSDYRVQDDGGVHTYRDTHQLAVEFAGYRPYVSTRNTDDLEWLEMLGVESAGNSRISVYGLGPTAVERAKTAVSSKVSVVGEGKKHRKGLGKTWTDAASNDEPSYGIGCRDGVVLTPRGLYNVVLTEVTSEYPQGIAMIPIREIGDGDIRAGDLLSEVMQNGVVEYKSILFPSDDDIRKTLGVTSTLRTVIIHRRRQSYVLGITREGKIESSETTAECANRFIQSVVNRQRPLECWNDEVMRDKYHPEDDRLYHDTPKETVIKFYDEIRELVRQATFQPENVRFSSLLPEIDSIEATVETPSYGPILIELSTNFPGQPKIDVSITFPERKDQGA